MGASLSNETENKNKSELVNSDSYDLETLINMRSNLGTMKLSEYENTNTPSELKNTFNKNAEIVNNFGYFHLPQDNLGFLNQFFVDVSTYMRLKYGETEWESELFPKDSLGADLKLNRMELLKEPYSDDVLKPLKDKLGDEFVLSKVKSVYKASSVYQFPDDSLKIKLPFKKVKMSDCSLGSENDEFTLYVDSEDHHTNCLFNEWFIYEIEDKLVNVVLDDNEENDNQDNKDKEDNQENTNDTSITLHILLGDGFGVELGDSESLVEYSDTRFNHLNDAISSCKNNNTRAMNSSLSKFVKWVNENKSSEIYARCGTFEGDNQNIVSMTDFMAKLSL